MRLSKGRELPYRIFDKVRKVDQAAIVENKRLGAVLACVAVRRKQLDVGRSKKANLLGAIGRLSAQTLELNAPLYSRLEHYEGVENPWIGALALSGTTRGGAITRRAERDRPWGACAWPLDSARSRSPDLPIRV